MKKFFAFIIGAALLFQTSAVFAADEIYGMPSSTLEPAIASLLSFNHWLYQNGYEGINYINKNYFDARAQAMQWDQGALLRKVTVYNPPVDGSSCDYEFGAADKTDEVFDAACVDPQTSTLEGHVVPADTAVSQDELFDLQNMTLRNFVSNILASMEVLYGLRDYFGGDSVSGTTMVFAKSGDEVHWTWGIDDNTKARHVDVYANTADRNAKPQMIKQ